MKIASWNINSLKVRLPHVLQWLETANPDVLALQELKMADEFYPKADFEQMGYQSTFSGQKTYNGVAILSKVPVIDVQKQMPNFVDEQQRVLAATVNNIRIINLYVPNGAGVGTEKYAYKLKWLQALKDYLKSELEKYEHVVVLGDFNIAPEDQDVYNPAKLAGEVLVSEPERQALRDILDLGFADSFRLFPQAPNIFSWWDYRTVAFRRNHGLRIDLILISHHLKNHCYSSYVDIEPRQWERPSDHTPVICEIKRIN